MNDLPVSTLVPELVRENRSFDLSHQIAPGIPVFPHHVPFSVTLNRRHADGFAQPRPGDTRFSNEIIVMSAHTATHVDALGHFSRSGMLYGGVRAQEVETPTGLDRLDAAEIPPFFCRAVLLDVAGHRRVPALTAGEAITADELRAVTESANVEIRAGDVVLIRTGWQRHWGDDQRYNGGVGGDGEYQGTGRGWPGIDESAARWLAGLGVRAVGADTPVVEVIPFTGDSVHAILLVDSGIYLFENLALDEFAAHGRYEALFIAVPLPLRGATGSPVRPLVIV
ncbi:cyclase family protein [Micromonospora sp. NBC_01412]|uniref:cyclase family protein n=1 Tax=Micromonospora sp. NBC_01412 TaxID=2903590 RepID=UPI003246830F